MLIFIIDINSHCKIISIKLRLKSREIALTFEIQIQSCLNQGRAFLKLQSQEFICHPRQTLPMLSSKKAYANMPNQVLQELEFLWSKGHSSTEDEIVLQGNRLLSRFLEVSISHRVKKPDWRSVYLKHLAVMSSHKNVLLVGIQRAFGLYYFKIACQLSKEISLANLSRLLQKKQNISLNINASQLKINYFKYLNDPKNFSFIEKTSIKLCRYIASLSIKNDSIEDLFKHYLLALISNLQLSLKEKMRPIILAAFDSYCVYCIKHQASMPEIKLNIFNLMDNLMNLYSSNPSDHSAFYPFLLNFSTLIRTQPLRRFVCQFGQVCRVPEITQKTIKFIHALYQGHQFTIIQLLQKLYLGVLLAKQSQHYFLDLPQNNLTPTHSNERLDCLVKLLTFQSQIFKFKSSNSLKQFNQSIEPFMSTLTSLSNYFSREELQKIVGLYLFDLNNVVIQNLVPKIQAINVYKILEVSRSHMYSLIDWAPVCQSVLKILQIINHQSKYELTIVAHQEYSVYLSIFQYLLQPNDLNLLKLLGNIQSPVFSWPCSSMTLFRVLISINKLCLSQLCQPCFQAFLRAISNFNFQYLVQNSKCYLLFSNFNKLENPFLQKTNRYQTIFSVDLLITYVKAVLKTYKTLSEDELEQNQDNWRSLLSAIIIIIGQHFHILSEETVDQIMASIINMKISKKRQNILKVIKNIVSKEVFGLIKHQEFLPISQFRQFLSNYLQLYKNVLSQKQEISLDEKLDFVDFCFNLKSSLYDLFHCFKKQKEESCIQDLIDSLQSIQLQSLQSNAVQFIHSLYIMLEEDNQPNLSMLASISIKLIFCLIYPNCFVFDKGEPKQFRMSADSLQNPGVSSKQSLFVQQQLQNSSSLLKMIKTRCKKLQNIFQRLPFLRRFRKISQQIVIFEEMGLQSGQVQSLRIHLADLIYLTYLCGLSGFKNLLFSLYLTITQRYYGVQIYLFQIARFLALELFETYTLESLKRYLEIEIQHRRPRISESFEGPINLMLKGEVTQNIYESKRIFRILYYLKNDALPIANDYKTIIWYLCSQVFTFFHQPFEDVQRQKSLLKMSKELLAFNPTNKQNWTSEIWKQDWSCLRLLILFFRKIFQKILQLNELSKIRSILPFALATLIKSGHFDELALPIQIMMLKKKDVDFVQIADNLLKLVVDEINPSEYKKIDRILCGRRKSLSMGFNLDGLARTVDRTFQKAGRIGSVLADLFMMIIFQMMGANQWQKYKCRKKMAIYKEASRKIPILDNLLKAKELSIIEEMNHVKDLSQALIQLLFMDYGLALVLKDYISQFLDQAIQHSDTLSLYQNLQLDNLILKITVIFQEYNFTIKKFWCNHTEHLSLSDQSFANVQLIGQLLIDHKNIGLEYKNRIQGKIAQLQFVKYPLNIIFPMGSFVYNMACKDSLLVTFVKRVNFQDKIQVCEDIIRINSQVLSQGDMKLSLNHKKRKGLDSQLGKTILSTDFGIVDFDVKSILPSSILNEILSIHPSLVKFLQANQQDHSHHLQHFVKRYKLGDVQYIRNKIRKVAQKIDQSLKLKQGRDNLLIYLYSKYLSFSFEGIQSISNYKAVYRIPSLQYLLENQYKQRLFNIDLCKYLINTKNNLPQTEKKFQMVKKNFPHWVGIVGRVPPAEEIATLLNRDLFLYMGHGTGLEHIPASEYVKFRPTCAMLVYGCSSALMTYDRSQPFGCTFDFLMNGCPAYLGCLWNVTDVDLDRITAEMFLQEGEDDLSSILKQSKLNCYFPHLNGASIVVYGLPSMVIRK